MRLRWVWGSQCTPLIITEFTQAKASPRSVLRFDIDEEPEDLGGERVARVRVCHHQRRRARHLQHRVVCAPKHARSGQCTERCEHAAQVRVIGRRQIELYSRLIHTVDHVEGRLREGFDALDAFLCHAWAVTVTGAPTSSGPPVATKADSAIRLPPDT